MEARRDTSDGVEPLRPEAFNKEELEVEKEAEILGIGDEEDADSEDEKIGVCGGEDVVRMGAMWWRRCGADGGQRRLPEVERNARPEEADAEGGGRASVDAFAISELVYDMCESEGQGP